MFVPPAPVSNHHPRVVQTKTRPPLSAVLGTVATADHAAAVNDKLAGTSAVARVTRPLAAGAVHASVGPAATASSLPTSPAVGTGESHASLATFARVTCASFRFAVSSPVGAVGTCDCVRACHTASVAVAASTCPAAP